MRSTLQAKTAPSRTANAPKPSRQVRVNATPHAFFAPWTHESNSGQLPARVQDYLALLAESSTTPGGVQKHLMKLMAKGAGHALKLSDLNPLDTLADVVADAGTDFVMKQVQSTHAQEAWQKLRRAVIGTNMFKIAAKGPTHDDSYEPPPKVDPVHAKALSLLVSVVMSGAVSGAAHALPADMPFLSSGVAAVEMTQVHTVNLGSTFEHAPSFRAAPSYMLKADGAEVVGTGGMAASTAMKLLRADSKMGDMMPDLKDIFSSAMDSIEECDEACLDKMHNAMRNSKVAHRVGPGDIGNSGGPSSSGPAAA